MSNTNQLSPEKYIVSKGTQLPFNDCYINALWEEAGLATILISKLMPSQKLISALYLVDVRCLGIKDTTYRFAISKVDYEEYKNDLIEKFQMQPCDLVLAHNIIFGAHDYAEELGFRPHPDFVITQHLLNPELIDDGIDQIEFGKNGKPLFIAGEYDNVPRILTMLRKNVGDGNFDFISNQPDNK